MKTKSGNKFFQPVVGGQKDGYTFWKHLFKAQFLGVLLVLIGFEAAILFQMTVGIYKLVLLAIMLVAKIVLIGKSLQHWVDLKNHTSR